MNAYQILETYLPEMTEIRKGYNQFINDNKILKSEDDKLFDYFLLIRHAYQKHDFNYCFAKPDFNILLDYPKNYKTINVVLDAVNTLLSHKLRYREMNDKINGFPSVVLKELEVLPNKEGYDINHQDYWTWKKFPPFDRVSNIPRMRRSPFPDFYRPTDFPKMPAILGISFVFADFLVDLFRMAVI